MALKAIISDLHSNMEALSVVLEDIKSQGIEAVIVREVPSAATRRALIVRGDADLYMDVPAKDAKELKEGGKLKVSGAPIDNCLHVLGLNVKYKPFDNLKVRQAIAYELWRIGIPV